MALYRITTKQGLFIEDEFEDEDDISARLPRMSVYKGETRIPLIPKNVILIEKVE